ncbi:MAG: hypothetical protein J5826_04570 [Bacteroidales bacterium]|nr:hypothetical protein [Bacteroidales bacterium]
MQKQLTKYVVMAAICTLLVAVIFMMIIPDKSSWAVYATPAFFAAVSIISALVITKPKYSKFAKFSGVFMLSTVLKLILYFAFLMMAYAALPLETRKPFVFCFMAIYLVFAIMDTMFLLRFFGKKDK